MKKKLSFLLLVLCACLNMTAQKFTVTGNVINEHDQRPVELATVRLLTTDSALVTGTFTDSIGNFTLNTDRTGNFIVYATYVGFKPGSKIINLANRDSVNVGTLKMMSNDIALNAAVVTATLARVEQKEDTTIFNAGAYRTPEGATLEALIKQFPGVEVSESGKITWNGKEVKEFLINGKDFFKGDTDVAMKNLPVNLVSKVKAYDKKSDYSEQTGIDDGEETTVLDIMTKRELNQSLISNIDVAGGWDWHDHALYSGKVFVTRFTDNSRFTFFGSRNNIGDAGFGGPRGMGGGGGGNGITTSTMGGFDFSWNRPGIERWKAGYVEIGGDIRYNGRNNETESTSSSETFMSGTTAQSFDNSHSWSTSKSHNVSSSLRFQWCPDTLTSLSFRPSYSFSKNNSRSNSRSATFDKDPFAEISGAESTDDVLNEFFIADPYDYSYTREIKTDDAPDWLVNLNNNYKLSESQSHNVNGNLNITRRLTGKKGRNISFQANGGWSKSESFSYSKSNIFTRQNQGGEGGSDREGRADEQQAAIGLKDKSTHQFSTNPSMNWNVRVGASYVEPIVGKWFGELRYNYEHKFTDSDRSLYDLYNRSSFTEFLATSDYSSLNNLVGLYVPEGSKITDWMDPTQALSMINENDLYAAVKDQENSQYATYKYDNQRINAGIRYNTQDINFNASVSFNPEHTDMHYVRSMEIDTARTVFTISPQVRFRYNFSKTNRMEIFYRGNSNQPSMTNLLPVVDTSNPLRISAGNPGLDPSWSDSFRFNYNGYNSDRQAGTNVYASFNNQRRSISTLQIYDETSGIRYSRPENINGNWSTNGGFMYNIGLGAQKLFTVSTSTNLSYNNSVGYSSSNQAAGDYTISENPSYEEINNYFNHFMKANAAKTTAKTTNVGENVNLAFRQAIWDFSVNGRVNYQHSVSDALNANNMDTWGFAYGASANVTLDCGFAISTDIRMNSRRGYSEKTMNTNELIWNAQFSQSFLKGKALTLSVQFYDILQQQSNISRNVSALMRSDNWNNAINSYFMVHLIYKLNIFNGSHSNNGGGEGRGSGRGGFGGGPGGGYGGGPGGRF